MELVPYKLKLFFWPPPRDKRAADTYLFGFDDDNQPYIIKWEDSAEDNGWVATTLSCAGEATAKPYHYTDSVLNKLIKYWADAPCLMSTIGKLQAERKNKAA